MIADILFEVAWKSTAVAAAVVALLFVMRSQAPSNRVAVGGLGLTLLLLLPAMVLTLALLPVPAIEMAAPAASVAAMPMALEPGAMQVPFSAAPEAEAAAPLLTAERLALLWGVGALFVLLRLAAGLATLWRWTERAELVASPEWRAMLRRCGVPDTTLLLVSSEVAAPLSWGWRLPVILVNRETLANAAEAEAVIAHEAAHLSRGDWPRLLAARLVVALFWFNPFVWLLERLYLQDVEEAADAEATRRVEPAHYAQALLNVARNVAVPAGANSIASGALSKRIRQVLRRRPRSRWERTWRVGALTSVAAIAGPIAAVQFVAPAASAAAEPAPVAAPAPLAATPRAMPVAPAVPEAPAAPGRIALPAIPAPTPAIAPMALAAAQAAPAPAPRAPEIDEEALEQALEAAEEASERAAVAVRRVDRAAIRAQVAAARAQAATARANAREQMRHGADQMERGAEQMRRGAAQMREEARKLRNPAYRAEQIAKARARGDDHIPTDQELIDAIPKMEEGARKMDAGVEKMREGAAKMRRQASNQ